MVKFVTFFFYFFFLFLRKITLKIFVMPFSQQFHLLRCHHVLLKHVLFTYEDVIIKRGNIFNLPV